MTALHSIALYLRPIGQSLAALGVWLILLMLVFVPLERLFPLRRDRYIRNGFGRDVGYYFLNGILPGLVLGIPLTTAAWMGHHVLPSAMTTGFTRWPAAMRLFAAMAVAEVGLYWGHRWCHQIPLLWRFHAIHHSPTHIDFLVNSRGHPVDFVFTRLCGLTPMYALGMGSPIAGDGGLIPVLVMLIGPAWGFFIHANVRWRFGPLEWLIATPAFHHWHHANDDPSVINKNYAPMWPFIDRLFGTFHLPPDRHPAVFGTDSAVATSFSGQLFDPFAAPPQPPRPGHPTE